MKNEEKIRAVIEEAAKLLRDYPELKYYEAIHRAKEVLRDEGKIQKLSKSNDNTGCN